MSRNIQIQLHPPRGREASCAQSISGASGSVQEKAWPQITCVVFAVIKAVYDMLPPPPPPGKSDQLFSDDIYIGRKVTVSQRHAGQSCAGPNVLMAGVDVAVDEID